MAELLQPQSVHTDSKVLDLQKGYLLFAAYTVYL